MYKGEETDYDDIVMSTRLRNVLRRNGFKSLIELTDIPKEYFIRFRNMGEKTLQGLLQICDEQKINLYSVESLNDRENKVLFDVFLCREAFKMGIKSKDDLKKFSLAELEEKCPKDKVLYVKLKKLKSIYG